MPKVYSRTQRSGSVTIAGESFDVLRSGELSPEPSTEQAKELLQFSSAFCDQDPRLAKPAEPEAPKVEQKVSKTKRTSKKK